MLLQQVINFCNLFVVTAVIVRNIPRTEYGELALVLSYSIIFNLINISASSILLRDYPKLTDHNISRYKKSFDIFNYYKSVSAILIAFIIAIFFKLIYGKDSQVLITILLVNTLTIICQYFTDPFQSFLSVSFRQSLITRIIFITSVINLIFTFGVYFIPNIIFVVSKNFAISLVTLLLMRYYFKQNFKYKTNISHRSSLSLLWKNLSDFSIWTHVQGIFTDIIYRADILILGWLNTPFQILGNYNIALQISNMTKILPQIIQYHATLCVSNSENDQKRQNEVVHIFLKINFIISILIMIGYLLLGKLMISIITGNNNGEIFEYGLYILGGLCIFNTLRPLVAYSIVAHSIKQCVLYINLPAAIFAIGAYLIGGIFLGIKGILIANIAIGVILCALTINYVNRKTTYKWNYTLLTDYEKSFFKYFWLKFVSNTTGA